MKKYLSIFLTLILCTVMFAGCGNSSGSSASTPASQSTASGEASTATEPAGIINIGLVTAVTGTNSLVGKYAVNGFNLAANQINAEGGILGQQVELIVGDEVDNLDASVKATQQLLANSDVTAIIGSMYSAYCIAALPSVEEAKLPYFSSGSSSGVSKEKNPYTWQVRPLDTAQGAVMADYVVNTLALKNPAVMYSSQSALTSQATQTIAALKERGLEMPDSSIFPFPEDESNYAPYLAQVIDGGFDGLIVMANQQPAAVICQQAEIAGIDAETFPCIGSTSFCSGVCLSNAGTAADYWYSVADWVPGGVTEASAAFEKAYNDAYGEASDLPAVIVYDALMLIKAACETANTTTDKEAINAALQQVKNYPGAVSQFSYFEDHSFATTLGITQNINQKAEMVHSVTYR